MLLSLLTLLLNVVLGLRYVPAENALHHVIERWQCLASGIVLADL